MTTTESKQKAVDYAKNYPLIQKDGFYGPVSIANIGPSNNRDIINLCVKTLKSQPNNASISFPKEWDKASKFSAGDQVNFKVEGGYVKNIYVAKPMSITKSSTVSAAAINDKATEALEDKAASDTVEEALAEVETKAELGETASTEEAAF